MWIYPFPGAVLFQINLRFYKLNLRVVDKVRLDTKNYTTRLRHASWHYFHSLEPQKCTCYTYIRTYCTQFMQFLRSSQRKFCSHCYSRGESVLLARSLVHVMHFQKHSTGVYVCWFAMEKLNCLCHTNGQTDRQTDSGFLLYPTKHTVKKWTRG